MQDVLDQAIRSLPTLLAHRSEWKSVDVTYHPPHVERLWLQWGPYRIFLHRIWSCDGDALYHPHPWPCAVYIVSGQYAMRVGTDGVEAANLVLTAGASYEMLDPDAWHSVRPMGGPSDSIMVVGAPYSTPRSAPVIPDAKQPPLAPERSSTLLDEWAQRLPITRL